MNTNHKQKCERKHFERRCEERLGIKLNPKEIEIMIRSGKLRLLDHQSLRVKKYLYEFESKDYVIVYDKKRKRVVTIFEYKGKKGE